MEVVALRVIEGADARIPNAVSYEKKLNWLNGLESRIATEICPVFGEYGFYYSGQELLLPFDYDCVEQIYCNGVYQDKIDLRSSTALPHGEYRLVYRIDPIPMEPLSVTDAAAVFDGDHITLSGPPPFVPQDFIGISGTGANDLTATVLRVTDNTLWVDDTVFAPGTFEATLSRIDDRALRIPETSACFGVYEEYLCMQLAKELGDTERYRLCREAFTELYDIYARHCKKAAPQNRSARIRGV